MRVRSAFGKILRALYGYCKYKHKSQYEIEKAEQVFYIQYLQPGMVAFDVGANIGEISLMFSRFVGPQGVVHSFECCPDTYDRLSEIISLSNRKNIIANSMCLSDVVGEAEFHIYDDDHATWNTMGKRPLEKYGIDVQPVSTETVPTTTIDEYCKTHNIQQIDLLKIDVEGAEYQVLKGASSMMRDHSIRCVIFEFGQTTFDMGNTPADLNQLISDNGYTIRNLVKDVPIFPGGTSVATAQYSMHVCTPRA